MADAHWRNTARSVRLGPINAGAVFPILLLMFWTSWVSFGLVVGCIAFLTLVELSLRMTPVIAWRAVRALIGGRRCAAVPFWRVNRF